jgi:hypothetical protein
MQGTIATWSLTLRTATTIETSPDSAPIDRSRSPLVSGMSSAIVSTNSTACEPKMFEKFETLRNALGEWMPKPTITRIQAIGSITLSSALPRRDILAGVGGVPGVGSVAAPEGG